MGEQAATSQNGRRLPCDNGCMIATLQTTAGDIRVELYPNQAPVTVANFTGLATGAKEWKDPVTGEQSNDPFYDGLVFHRVIDGFMIQGGCPIGTGTGGPGYTFDDEITPELRFDGPYILAMANAGKRTNPITGKPGGTNGSQFFITLGPTPHLNGAHTIFGKVIDDASKAVVDAIGSTPVGRGDRPVDDVMITGVTIED
jgi:peptidyl-prolyl cis-trans isomerase A (cyclophilin A)